MTQTPKTIQIFLPSGDPRGIRSAEITTRILRVIDIPRSLVGDFVGMGEAGQVGLYFLVGESEDGKSRRLYIGQSGVIGARISQHNQSKDFWTRALAVISLTNSLTQTHALFLEWLSIREAQLAGRYTLENGNAGAKPHTPPPLEADCHEIYETARILLATLGHPIFESVSDTGHTHDADDVFFCKSPSGGDARGIYTSEGFVILKGSKARLTVMPSVVGTTLDKKRLALIEEGALVPGDANLVFEKDVLFNAPSLASSVVLGGNSNGWTSWKAASGKTLNELKRQPAAT